MLAITCVGRSGSQLAEPVLDEHVYLPLARKGVHTTPGDWRWRLIIGRWDTQDEAEAWGCENLPAGMEWEPGLFFSPW